MKRAMIKSILSFLLIISFGAMPQCFSKNIAKESRMDSQHSMKEGFKIIGIECRTSNDPEVGSQDIPALWQRFYGENIQSKIPNRVSDEVVALYCDYESDHTGAYSCVIGCKVSATDVIPDGMVAKEVPSATYAKYHVAGEFPNSLINTWQKIWGSDLDRTFTGDFEIYGSDFNTEKQELDVFIAVEN